jgi:hypothetical protein
MRSKLLWSAAAVIVAQIGFNPRARASDYYFSPGGNDSNVGNSSASPFASLAKLNSLTLGSGDNVYLEGGANFAGNIQLDANDTAVNAAGAPIGAPIKISNYGTGYATINAGNGTGISALNNGNIEISNLKLVGSGSHLDAQQSKYVYDNTGNGIEFINTNGVKNQHIVVNNVEAQNFGGNGVWLGASGQSGYDGVTISRVIAHQNQLAGIATMGDPNNGNRNNFNNVLIQRSTAFNNYGRDKAPNQQNSGSGIVIGQVSGGKIEKSVAYGNGVRCDSTQGGPVGIWAWDSANIVIQKNESYNNGVAGQLDGGGFDLDGGVINSVIQYNYSHGNTGAGYLLAQYPGAKPMGNNIIRFNVSQNDAQKNDFGAIHIWGDVDDAKVYNNTVFVGPAGEGNPSAVRFAQWSGQGVTLANNLLMADKTGGSNDPSLIAVTGGAAGDFLGNAYWNDGQSGVFNPSDLQAMYLSVANDPKLFGPAGEGPTFSDADQLLNLQEYLLNDDSPLVDQGLNLALYGINPGGFDFLGQGQRGNTWDIGAFENQSGPIPIPEPAAAGLLALSGIALLRRSRRTA